MDTLATVQKMSTPIFKQYGVMQASVFGSFARGSAGPDSDVDMVVSLREPIGLFKFFEMNNRLEEALGRKVDLATPRSLNPRLAKRIAHDLTTIYEG